MTPQQLHAALDERRRTLGLPWWRVAIQLQISGVFLNRMRHGHLSKPLRARVEAWLGEAS
ncbi:hypothetical protein FH608_046425 [Nonomuraea phyllanthi]|uniref:XRE family transcriptional regulator n=1 Tax=Nonomuraea phyllanthi TaxID=2219224 RepID=A0A5C4V607_9ACTN|nr:hypothetical protein [Nonomuraea phyllanthi]KAB8186929.1 hypothetical protein FH608_046425 [Nonomuraea phyllanthi]